MIAEDWSKQFHAWVESYSTMPLLCGLRRWSLVTGPNEKHLDDVFIFDDLINQAMLQTNAAGVNATQIAEEFLEWRRFSERIFGVDGQELFRLGPEPAEARRWAYFWAYSVKTTRHA
jgi:hypothetical protein